MQLLIISKPLKMRLFLGFCRTIENDTNPTYFASISDKKNDNSLFWFVFLTRKERKNHELIQSSYLPQIEKKINISAVKVSNQNCKRAGF